MVRYHFVGAGFWQAGLGYSGPIGSGSGMRYQLDYYHTNGRFISPGGGLPGVSGNTDTILVGVRWTGGR